MTEETPSTCEPIPEGFIPPLHRALGIGIRIDPDRKGSAFIEVDPNVHYGNRWAHGGMATVLADIAAGIAIALAMEGDGRETIDGTIELKVNFLRKVYDGDMTATAEVVHLGKRTAVTDVNITNKGRLCAKAVATYMLSRSKD